MIYTCTPRILKCLNSLTSLWRCRCFKLPPISKFLILRVWLGWCAKRTQDLCWFVQNVPTSSLLLLLVLLAQKVCSRGYKWSREGWVPSLWWCVAIGSDRFGWVWARMCSDAGSVVWCLMSDVRWIICSMPLNGTPCFPFYRPRESRGYNGGKRGKMRRRRSPPESSGPFPSCGSHRPCRRQ